MKNPYRDAGIQVSDTDFLCQYLALISGRAFWMSLIRRLSLGCVLMNSGTLP